MAVEVDPIASKDGTPAKVENVREEGRIKTQDDTVIQVLQSIDDKLTRILTILEFEFEHQTEEQLSGQD